jgi:hypothetical protein
MTLTRIGEQPMVHMLSQTSIFLALPGDSDCFAQATGTIVTDLEPLSDKQATKTPKLRQLHIRRLDHS